MTPVTERCYPTGRATGNGWCPMAYQVQVDQWLKKARELFGGNRKNWQWVCPQCGNAMSLERYYREFSDVYHLHYDYEIEKECIGNYTDKAGCDYSVFDVADEDAPVIVFVPSSGMRGRIQMHVMDFATKPYTKGETNATS